MRMSCESWREAILERVAGEASEETAIAVEQHLAECAACAEEARRLALLLEATGPGEAWTAGSQMEERLVRELRPRVGAWTALWRWRVPAYAVLGVALVSAAIGARVAHRARPEVTATSEPAPWLAQETAMPALRFATTPTDAIGVPDSL
jgi:anti-sigma factor RsiW